MNTFYKWFHIVAIPVSAMFAITFILTGLWMPAITWIFIGLTSYYGYQSDKYIAELRAEIERLNDQ